MSRTAEAATVEARAHPHLDRIVDTALALGLMRVAVAYPCSGSSLEAAVDARKLGLIDPILVGPIRKIAAIAVEIGLDLGGMELLESGEEPTSAARASVALCRDGNAKALMKGSLHTDELMAAVVDKDRGIRTARRVSHAFVFDMPSYGKPLLMGDCVVNIAPGLMEKKDITQNTIDLAHLLGMERPYVAILSAVETINPAIPGTIEAAALCKMADRGQLMGAQIEGPLGFDIAISLEAARMKGIESGSHGRPDILIVPNLEAGNLLYKQLIYLAGGRMRRRGARRTSADRADEPRGQRALPRRLLRAGGAHPLAQRERQGLTWIKPPSIIRIIRMTTRS